MSDCFNANLVTASYTPSNRVSWTSVNAAVNGFIYDAAGNVTSDGKNNYACTAHLAAEGRLCAVQVLVGNTPVAQYQYLYNAAGLRVGKASFTGTFPAANTSCAAPGAAGEFKLTKQYLLDLGGNQVTELDGAGVWQHSNVWAGSHLTATYDTLGLHFHLADPLGTRRVQTNYKGAVENSFQSLPFGDGLQATTTALTTADDATENHFTGKERDTESGLDNFGARYYGSSMGRFMSPDPGGLLFQKPQDPQSWNLYAYARNNPLSNLDPTGLDCVYANDAGNGVESIDHSSNSGECGSNGGSWVPGYADENWAHYNGNTNMSQVGSINGAGAGATVDYTMFGAGDNTGFNSTDTACSGCAGFASANANWLQGQLAGNSQPSGLDGYIQFLTGREETLHGGLLNQLVSGPLDPSTDHWAGRNGAAGRSGRLGGVGA